MQKINARNKWRKSSASRFSASYRDAGFLRQWHIAAGRASQIVERIHVKITFITLCNQLVKAISLKAWGEGFEPVLVNSRSLLLHNAWRSSPIPSFPLPLSPALGLAAIIVYPFFGILRSQNDKCYERRKRLIFPSRDVISICKFTGLRVVFSSFFALANTSVHFELA